MCFNAWLSLLSFMLFYVFCSLNRFLVNFGLFTCVAGLCVCKLPIGLYSYVCMYKKNACSAGMNKICFVLVHSLSLFCAEEFKIRIMFFSSELITYTSSNYSQQGGSCIF
uniref:Uncharacterized protein n=1 Tax=Utricularia reniformis TaxID=192314 RepID=A0A1Y0AZ44_9LAMI|nr:hypothetical protein AEK19_MT2141 [Utricularia reniformis]ART30435.1 hypothetical protein AEK19_MT2141 [Utricularia reniformis]